MTQTPRQTTHFHDLAQGAHQTPHISVGITPAVAIHAGVQKGLQGLHWVWASRYSLLPCFVLPLKEPLGEGEERSVSGPLQSMGAICPPTTALSFHLHAWPRMGRPSTQSRP